MTTLRFPEDRIVGTLDWRGRRTAESYVTRADDGGPVFATGIVEVPDNVGIILHVGEYTGAERTPRGWTIHPAQRPSDLSFLRQLPEAAVSHLRLGFNVVQETFDAVVSLTRGLTNLCLGHTGFDDRVLPYVAQLVNLTNLQTFGNTFTDAGIQQLASLRRLKDLTLEEETLTVAAFDFVTELPDLVRLDMWDVQMTDDEHANLRARLPSVDVGKNGHGP